MARFEITAPDGGKYEITAPDTATEADVARIVSSQFKAPPRESTGTLAAGLEGAAQGLTFNFSDEIEGAGRAAYNKLVGGDQRPWGDLYNESVKIPRERQKAAAETNPLAYYGGEIGSSLLVPGALARAGIRGPMAAAAGRSLGARSVAGAAEGAAYGAAYGAGSGEGAADTLGKAGSGAALGGVIGGAVPAIVDVGSAAVSRFTQPIKAALNPEQQAGSKLAEAFQRDAALPKAAEATARDLERVNSRFATMQEINPRAVIADVGDENVRNLMRTAANQSSAGAAQMRRTLDNRAAGQWSRIENQLVSGADDAGHDVRRFASRNRSADEYFDQLEARTARMAEIGERQLQPALAKDLPMTQRLQDVLERPSMKILQEKVARNLADEGQAIGRETRMQMMHRIKMELDYQIDQAVKANKMGQTPQNGWTPRGLTRLKHAFMGAIDNPEYKTALRAYASQAQLKNRLEEGYEGFKSLQPEEIRKTMRRFDSTVERDFFRIGALRKIIEDVRTGNANRDRTDGVFSSPLIQKKLRAIAPSREWYREMQRFLVSEAKMADTRKAVQGNSTSAKQLINASEAMAPARGISAVANATMGRLEPALNWLGKQYNIFAGGMTPAVSNKIIEMGMSKDPRLMQGLYERGIAQARELPAQRAALVQQLLAAQAAASNNKR